MSHSVRSATLWHLGAMSVRSHRCTRTHSDCIVESSRVESSRSALVNSLNIAAAVVVEVEVLTIMPVSLCLSIDAGEGVARFVQTAVIFTPNELSSLMWRIRQFPVDRPRECFAPSTSPATFSPSTPRPPPPSSSFSTRWRMRRRRRRRGKIR